MQMQRFVLAITMAFLFLAGNQSQAQGPTLSAANRYYENLAYSKAIPYYLRALKKDSTLEEAIFKVADCYRLTNNMREAEKYYAKVVASPNAQPIHKYHYSRVLLSAGKYEEAGKWLNTTEVKGGYTNIPNTSADYAALFADSADYVVKGINVNSGNADFAAVAHKEGIVFASSRKKSGAIARKHAWTNQPFLNVYYSKWNGSEYEKPSTFTKSTSSKLNDGPVSFSADGKQMWFTRNQKAKRSARKKKQSVKLKIFSANSTGTGWSTAKAFSYNSDDYSVSHPSISADGNKLYFISDMPGGLGGMDIYVCQRQDTGWSAPKNLGPTINTASNELFPCIMSDGTLYFSSEGWNGLGGLDIFVCPDPAAARPVLMNAGYPVNTRNDDFALHFNTGTNKGFISSNRAAGGVNDDNYSLERTGVTIRGIVVRKEDGVALKNAKVVLDNGAEYLTGPDGRFQFRGELKKDYTAKASAPWRYDASKTFNTKELHPGLPFVLIEMDLRLYKAFIQVVDSLTMQPLPGAIIRDAASGQQLGVADADGIFAHTLTPGKAEQLAVEHKGFATRQIEIMASPEDMTDDIKLTAHLIRTDEYYLDWTKTVYFDLNKHAIRTDAGTTLDEVVALLKEKRHFKIAITAGCDSRASDTYNDALSRNRSASVRKYLVSKGVKANQIKKVKWTGEKSLVNNCTDETPCSEEMHQQNRRSDIVVVEIK